MDLFADRDPEEARKLLDSVLDHMMEAVHRYEGTVIHALGDGIVALFGGPLPMRIMRFVVAMPRCGCRRVSSAMRRVFDEPKESLSRSG